MAPWPNMVASSKQNCQFSSDDCVYRSGCKITLCQAIDWRSTGYNKLWTEYTMDMNNSAKCISTVKYFNTCKDTRSSETCHEML